MIAMFPIVGLSAMSVVGAGMSFWEGFYFACFIAGLLLSVISLVGGMGHIHLHFHGLHLPLLIADREAHVDYANAAGLERSETLPNGLWAAKEEGLGDERHTRRSAHGFRLEFGGIRGEGSEMRR